MASSFYFLKFNRMVPTTFRQKKKNKKNREEEERKASQKDVHLACVAVAGVGFEHFIKQARQFVSI